jgi:hypothetical protein
MPFVFKRLALLMSIAAAFAADKETPFKAPPAGELAHHQTNGKVTIGAEPYVSGDKVKAAFGKLVPYTYGVLPVLVVLQNDSGQTIQLDKLKAEYSGPNGSRADATPAADVRYTRAPAQPSIPSGPLGGIMGKKKNPLDVWEIEGRALAAQMLPAGNTASGFLYFQTGIQKGSTISISGLTEAGTGKELLYFEIPLQ